MNMRAIDYERECLAHMHANGIPFAGSLKSDGQVHRFSMDAKKNQLDEWYVCHEGISLKGNPYLVCMYGTWSGGQKSHTYKSYDSNQSLSSEELIQIRAQEDARRKLFEKQQQEDRQQRVKQAQEAGNSLSTSLLFQGILNI